MTIIHSPQLDNKSRMIEWVYIAWIENVSLISPRPRSPCLDLKQQELNLKYLKKLQAPELVNYRGCWIYACHDIFKTSIPGASKLQRYKQNSSRFRNLHVLRWKKLLGVSPRIDLKRKSCGRVSQSFDCQILFTACVLTEPKYFYRGLKSTQCSRFVTEISEIQAKYQPVTYDTATEFEAQEMCIE